VFKTVALVLLIKVVKRLILREARFFGITPFEAAWERQRDHHAR
jgi:hypothetical protein